MKYLIIIMTVLMLTSCYDSTSFINLYDGKNDITIVKEGFTTSNHIYVIKPDSYTYIRYEYSRDEITNVLYKDSNNRIYYNMITVERVNDYYRAMIDKALSKER